MCGSWTVAQHIESGPEWVVPLFRLFSERVNAAGPCEYAPVRAQVGFRGTHRIFAAARLTKTGLRGYLDLAREVDNKVFTKVDPYTKRLFVHHFTLVSENQFDEEFDGFLREAHAVGMGEHLRRGTAPGAQKPASLV